MNWIFNMPYTIVSITMSKLSKWWTSN